MNRKQLQKLGVPPDCAKTAIQALSRAAQEGLGMGLNIRVGLEDNVRYSRDEMARDNAQLVERAVRIARELQLRPATPDEARDILGTRGRERGAVPAPVVADEQPVNAAPADKADGDEFST